MTTPTYTVASGVYAQGSAAATVHRVQDDSEAPRYYFCCEHCGNCSKHMKHHHIAMDEAFTHVYNHTKEGSDAP